MKGIPVEALGTYVLVPFVDIDMESEAFCTVLVTVVYSVCVLKTVVVGSPAGGAGPSLTILLVRRKGEVRVRRTYLGGGATAPGVAVTVMVWVTVTCVVDCDLLAHWYVSVVVAPSMTTGPVHMEVGLGQSSRAARAGAQAGSMGAPYLRASAAAVASVC